MRAKPTGNDSTTETLVICSNVGVERRQAATSDAQILQRAGQISPRQSRANRWDEEVKASPGLHAVLRRRQGASAGGVR